MPAVRFYKLRGGRFRCLLDIIYGEEAMQRQYNDSDSPRVTESYIPDADYS